MKRQRANNTDTDNTTTNTTPSTPNTKAPPPISLGKPSLRHRLESYYTLVCPSAISNANEWKTKFELIYTKYGGSVQGEVALSKKLMNKYGKTVRLLVAPRNEEIRRIASGRGRSKQQQLLLQQQQQQQSQQNEKVKKHKESHYDIQPKQKQSSVLLFTSPNLDIHEILRQPVDKVLQVNGMETNVIMLDNLSKCKRLLPSCDPLYIPPPPPPPPSSSSPTTLAATAAQPAKKKSSPYTLMSTTNTTSAIYTTGPLSLLHSMYTKQVRVRILIRYVDCVRSTLTGYVMAFDKHCNMILRDVDEVYTSRVSKKMVDGGTGGGDCMSKGELERCRRMDCIFKRGYSNEDNVVDGKKREIVVRQRHMKQLLVRGDNVVSLWRADDEQSSNGGKALRSIYVKKQQEHNKQEKKDEKKKEENGTVVVTPGFILPAAKQRLQRLEKKKSGRRNC